jgi:hypothetical protein
MTHRTCISSRDHSVRRTHEGLRCSLSKMLTASRSFRSPSYLMYECITFPLIKRRHSSHTWLPCSDSPRQPCHSQIRMSRASDRNYSIADLFVHHSTQDQQERARNNLERGPPAQDNDERRNTEKNRQGIYVYAAIALVLSVSAGCWAIAILYAIGGL